MRTVSSSMMAALVMVALFWGNCFSCPQVLLSLQTHSCCHHTKSPAANCAQPNLHNFVKADVPSHAAPAVSAALPMPPVVSAYVFPAADPVTPEVTPPPPLSLRI